MGKKLNVLKELAFKASLIYAVNAAVMPLASSLTYKEGEVNNPKIQQLMQTDKYAYDYYGTDEEQAEKYLKLAHAVTMRYMRLSDYGVGTTQDEKLEGAFGNCSETSPWTYSNYLYLTEKAGKKHLWEYVRESAGIVYYEPVDDGGGHAWIEIKKDGEWEEYETTANDLHYSTPIKPELIDVIVKDSEVYNDRYFYHRSVGYQVEEDRDINVDLDFYGIATDYKGFGYMLYKAFAD